MAKLGRIPSKTQPNRPGIGWLQFIPNIMRCRSRSASRFADTRYTLYNRVSAERCQRSASLAPDPFLAVAKPIGRDSRVTESLILHQRCSRWYHVPRGGLCGATNDLNKPRRVGDGPVGPRRYTIPRSAVLKDDFRQICTPLAAVAQSIAARIASLTGAGCASTARRTARNPARRS